MILGIALFLLALGTACVAVVFGYVEGRDMPQPARAPGSALVAMLVAIGLSFMSGMVIA